MEPPGEVERRARELIEIADQLEALVEANASTLLKDAAARGKLDVILWKLRFLKMIPRSCWWNRLRTLESIFHIVYPDVMEEVERGRAGEPREPSAEELAARSQRPPG